MGDDFLGLQQNHAGPCWAMGLSAYDHLQRLEAPNVLPARPSLTSSTQSRTAGHEPVLDAAAGLVSVLVSFVVVRLGSATAATGHVEHGADVDDSA